MAAGRYNITLEQGADFSLRVTIQDAVGAAINLTGHTFEARVRNLFDDVSPALTFSIASTDLPNGIITISATSAATAALSSSEPNTQRFIANWGNWDLEGTSSGVVTRYIYGSVTLSREATK